MRARAQAKFTSAGRNTQMSNRSIILVKEISLYYLLNFNKNFDCKYWDPDSETGNFYFSLNTLTITTTLLCGGNGPHLSPWQRP